MKQKLYFSMFLIIFLIFTSCSQTKNDSNDHLKVYTSIYPIQYLTEKISGNDVDVQSIFPPGADAHTYEPTAKEMVKIAKGDLFVFLGENMEGFIHKIKSSLDEHPVKFVELTEKTDILLKNKKNKLIDPHVWLDPLKMIKMGEIIKQELQNIDPKNHEKYEKNFEEVKKELLKLDRFFSDTLKKYNQKSILVSHDSFYYWENRFGIEQISIRGLFNEEPSQKEVTSISKKAKKRNIQYIVYNQTGKDYLTKAVQEQLNISGITIHNLENLTEEDIENGYDYIDLMQLNLQTLEKIFSKQGGK